jgi:hypothetical protein
MVSSGGARNFIEPGRKIYANAKIGAVHPITMKCTVKFQMRKLFEYVRTVKRTAVSAPCESLKVT